MRVIDAILADDPVYAAELEGIGNRAVLDAVADFLGAFVAFPSVEARDAVALWVLHGHAIEAAATTPRLSIRSAEKQCGKSRLLEVLELIVARPVLAVNISVAALFRSIGEPPPSILWDEVDALFRGGNDPGREDLRALLNSGYRRGASVLRMVGEGRKMEVKAFPTFAPVALAGIGNLPDTINDRSIVVELRRRLPGEKVRPFRRRTAEPEARELRERLEAWAGQSPLALEQARPSMPDGLSDRAQDLWEPLLAIADLAGGSWPKRARQAAVKLAKVGQDRDGSRGVGLLTDLRSVFNKHHDQETLATATLLAELVALEESPWGDLRGRPLDARELARRLKAYEVRPGNIRTGEPVLKGYKREHLEDAWARYLPPAEQPDPDPAAGPEPAYPIPPGAATSATNGVSDLKSVADRTAIARPELAASDPECSGVADVAVPQRGGRAEAQAPSFPATNGHHPEADGVLDLLPIEALESGPDGDGPEWEL